MIMLTESRGPFERHLSLMAQRTRLKSGDDHHDHLCDQHRVVTQRGVQPPRRVEVPQRGLVIARAGPSHRVGQQQLVQNQLSGQVGDRCAEALLEVELPSRKFVLIEGPPQALEVGIVSREELGDGLGGRVGAVGRLFDLRIEIPRQLSANRAEGLFRSAGGPRPAFDSAWCDVDAQAGRQLFD